MSAPKNEENLISQLLEETYEISRPSQVFDAGTLEHYFQLRTSQIEKEEENPFVQLFYLQGISFFPFVYVKEIGAFRINFKSKIIDFPQNWGVFEFFRESFESMEMKLFRIKDFDETLYEVLSGSEGFNGEPCLLKTQAGAYLFVLEDGDSSKIKMIQDLIEEMEIKKAS